VVDRTKSEERQLAATLEGVGKVVNEERLMVVEHVL
jgi:hypothetical protein